MNTSQRRMTAEKKTDVIDGGRRRYLAALVARADAREGKGFFLMGRNVAKVGRRCERNCCCRRRQRESTG